MESWLFNLPELDIVLDLRFSSVEVVEVEFFLEVEVIVGHPERRSYTLRISFLIFGKRAGAREKCRRKGGSEVGKENVLKPSTAQSEILEMFIVDICARSALIRPFFRYSGDLGTVNNFFLPTS